MTPELKTAQQPEPLEMESLSAQPGISDEVARQLVKASGAMRRSDDPDHVLDVLVSTALLVVPVTSVWAAWKSPGGPLSHATVFDPTATVAGPAVDREAMEAALESWGDQLAAGNPPFEASDAVTVFPMSSASRLGALVIGEAHDRLRPELAVISLLCDRALAALELASTRLGGRRTDALFETLTQLAGSYSDTELVLQTIVRSTARLLGMDAAYVMLVDEEHKNLRVRTAHGITSRAFYESTYSIDRLIPGEAIRRRKVVCARDLGAHDEARHSRTEGLRTTLCAPMFVEDELVGVLMAAHREIRELSAEDRHTMMALANAAAVSIGNARLYVEHEESIARLGELNGLLEERSAAGERTMAFQQRLTSLILQAGGLEEIVRVMSETLGCQVVILDRELAVLHTSPDAEIDTDSLRAKMADYEDATGIAVVEAGEHRMLVAPLDLAGARSAYVVVIADEPALEGADLGMTEAAVTAIGLELMRDRASAEAEARLTGGLFQELLAGEEDEQTLIRRASYLGYELQGANAAIAVVAEDQAGGRRPLSLDTCIQRAIRRRRDAPVAVFEREDALFVVLSDPDELPDAVISDYTALIKQELDVSGRSAGVRIAYAGPHHGIEGVRRAVQEASYALHVLGVLGRTGTPQAFGELGVWTLLGRAGDAAHLMSFADNVLGVLIGQDTERQSQLVDTVRTLVECNFHYRTAAEKLFTHPNTLRYRMSRINELTGLDFADADDRLQVEIALRILDAVGPVRE